MNVPNRGLAFYQGNTLQRILIALATLVVVAGFIGIIIAELKQYRWWISIKSKNEALFSSNSVHFCWFLSFCNLPEYCIGFVSCSFPRIQRTCYITNHFKVIWINPCLVLPDSIGRFLLNLVSNLKIQGIGMDFYLLCGFLSCWLSLLLFIFYPSNSLRRLLGILRMRNLEDFFFLPAFIFLLWGLLHQFFKEKTWFPKVNNFFLLAAIGIVTYTIYRHTAQWMAWTNTPSKAYWHELAEAFLQGRLFLVSPETLHDLTFFNGIGTFLIRHCLLSSSCQSSPSLGLQRRIRYFSR